MTLARIGERPPTRKLLSLSRRADVSSGLARRRQLEIRGARPRCRANSRRPYLPVPPSRPCKAVSRHLIRLSLSNGLVRKQIAPALIARFRMVSSGKAVMNMNGTRCPWASKRACSSTPLMAGIWTSAITHDVSLKWEDRKNSSAEAKVWTVYPSDLRRLSVATRMDASSSTIEITGGLGTTVYPSPNGEPVGAPPWGSMRREDGSENNT
jgi:hypothetical protein